MNVAETLYVSFGDQSVAVTSQARAIVAGTRDIFRWMLGPPARHLLGELVVVPHGAGYLMHGSPDSSPGDRSVSAMLRCIRYSTIRLFLDARPDLIWFHGGAAAAGKDGDAVVFPGERGRGKSTLVTTLCADGWGYLSDDVLPVDPSSGQVFPFPQTPAVRTHPGTEMPQEWLWTTRKRDVRLPGTRIVRSPRPIAAIVFPHYQPGADDAVVGLTPAPAALELLASCWNFHEHQEHALQHVSELAVRVPAYRITYSDGVIGGRCVADALKVERGRVRA